MNKKVILKGMALAATIVALFASCSGKEQEEIGSNTPELIPILKNYANIHDSGLDNIKLRAEKKLCLQFCMRSSFMLKKFYILELLQ